MLRAKLALTADRVSSPTAYGTLDDRFEALLEHAFITTIRPGRSQRLKGHIVRSQQSSLGYDPILQTDRLTRFGTTVAQVKS
jgi:hypothetical protein